MAVSAELPRCGTLTLGFTNEVRAANAVVTEVWVGDSRRGVTEVTPWPFMSATQASRPQRRTLPVPHKRHRELPPQPVPRLHLRRPQLARDQQVQPDAARVQASANVDVRIGEHLQTGARR